MILKGMWWMFPLWDGEAEGGAGGGDGDNPGNGGGDAGSEAATSLRAQLAGQLDDSNREPFTKWAESYKTDKEFVLGAMNLRSQFDARVPVPDEKAKPEVWDKYFQRVGKPTDPKEYKYDPPKGEDGKPMEFTDGELADLEKFKAYAHQNHYTQKQFEAGLKYQQEYLAEKSIQRDQAADQFQDATIEGFKQKWGPDFDANIAAAVDGGVAYAPSQQEWTSFTNLRLEDGTRVGDHPTLLETMAKIGRASGEDQRVRNMHQSGEADTIKAEIAKIEDEALKAGKLPSDKGYHERLEGLYKKLHPKTTQGSMLGSHGFGAS